MRVEELAGEERPSSRDSSLATPAHAARGAAWRALQDRGCGRPRERNSYGRQRPRCTLPQAAGPIATAREASHVRPLPRPATPGAPGCGRSAAGSTSVLTRSNPPTSAPPSLPLETCSKEGRWLPLNEVFKKANTRTETFEEQSQSIPLIHPSTCPAREALTGANSLMSPASSQSAPREPPSVPGWL